MLNYEEVVENLKYLISDDCTDTQRDFVEEIETAIEAVEHQIPKKPIWVEELYEHHDWEKDDNGNIDRWAMSSEFCNGPMCSRCYRSFCEHCHVEDYDEMINEKCDCSHFECPTCHKEIIVSWSENQKGVCRHCGQILDWS